MSTTDRSKSVSQQTVQVGEPSAEEQQFVGTQLGIGEAQLQSIQTAQDLVAAPAADLGEFADLTPEERELVDLGIKLQKQLVIQAEQGFPATPEQIANIEAAETAAFNAGEARINQSLKSSLNLVSEEAASFGLRPTDTPSIDRGGILAGQASAEKFALGQDITSAGFQARLNLPLESARVGSGLAVGAVDLANFQRQLSEQATFNRLQLGERQRANTLSAGLGLSGIGSLALSFPRDVLQTGFEEGKTKESIIPKLVSGGSNVLSSLAGR